MAQFKAYPKYKDSGVEWLGEVPEHWKISNIKRSTYLKGRVGWKGLTSNEFEVNSFAYLVTGTDFKQKYVNWSSCYQINESRYEDDPYIQLKNGDLLMTRDGTIGKLAIVKNLNKSACLNSGIFLIRPEKYYSTEFMYWVLNSNAFNLFFVMNTTGSTILHLYQNVFERFVFSYPNFKEQERIVSYLNLETAKIDTLIAKQEKLIELLKERIIALAMTEQIHGKGKLVRLCSVAHEVIRPVHLDDATDYVALGLYNRGRGLFHKPLTLGKDMGDSTFFYVDSGDLIISGQFAWEGAVAMASHNESGCVVSHRYPVIKGSVVDTMYLFALFMSDYGNFLLNDCSRGSAGRNRPLNKNILLKQKIRMPSDEVQKKIKDIFEKKQQLEININTTIEKLKEYRASVISHAVTGKIDVRELVA